MRSKPNWRALGDAWSPGSGTVIEEILTGNPDALQDHIVGVLGAVVASLILPKITAANQAQYMLTKPLVYELCAAYVAAARQAD